MPTEETALIVGLYFVTDMASAFTLAANEVYKTDPTASAAKIPDGFEGGALDFASSFLGYVIYACVKYLRWIGMGVLTLITIAMVVWNRLRIVREERESKWCIKNEQLILETNYRNIRNLSIIKNIKVSSP